MGTPISPAPPGRGAPAWPWASWPWAWAVVTGRLADADAEVVQRLEDVGVAAQQSGDEDGQQQHDDGQDNRQGNHSGTSVHYERAGTDAGASCRCSCYGVWRAKRCISVLPALERPDWPAR